MIVSRRGLFTCAVDHGKLCSRASSATQFAADGLFIVVVGMLCLTVCACVLLIAW